MSAPVVVIGYLLLIPSVLGIAVSTAMLLLMVVTTAVAPEFGAPGTPETVIVGSGMICFGIFCFVGGLLGWLLVMKKQVLQCDNCGAVVAAS